MREPIRDRELTSSHKLEQMRRVGMLEKQAAWKREGGFDRIEIIAQIHKQTLRRLHAGFASESFYTRTYNPRWPSNSDRTYAGYERRGREIKGENSTFAVTTAAAI